jgi:hypothetical protein
MNKILDGLDSETDEYKYPCAIGAIRAVMEYSGRRAEEIRGMKASQASAWLMLIGREQNMKDYKQMLIRNMSSLRYWMQYTEINGYNTHISFFKRPGKDGSGFESDKIALKNIIRSHVKTTNQFYELIAVVFNDVSFQFFWMEKNLADHARNRIKERFGKRCELIYRLS